MLTVFGKTKRNQMSLIKLYFANQIKMPKIAIHGAQTFFMIGHFKNSLEQTYGAENNLLRKNKLIVLTLYLSLTIMWQKCTPGQFFAQGLLSLACMVDSCKRLCYWRLEIINTSGRSRRRLPVVLLQNLFCLPNSHWYGWLWGSEALRLLQTGGRLQGSRS